MVVKDHHSRKQEEKAIFIFKMEDLEEDHSANQFENFEDEEAGATNNREARREYSSSNKLQWLRNWLEEE